MARYEKTAYDLSEAEKRDLVTLISAGQGFAGKIPFHLV